MWQLSPVYKCSSSNFSCWAICPLGTRALSPGPRHIEKNSAGESFIPFRRPSKKPASGWNKSPGVRVLYSVEHFLSASLRFVRGEKLSKIIIHDHNNDGIDRRGLLQCMAWAGTGVVWSVSAGVLTSRAFGQKMASAKGDLHFVQISDSHMGFNKPANPDVTGTLKATIDKINGLPQQPDFIIHTGDLSHTSKAAEFDTLDQVLQDAKPKQVFFVP